MRGASRSKVSASPRATSERRWAGCAPVRSVNCEVTVGPCRSRARSRCACLGALARSVSQHASTSTPGLTRATFSRARRADGRRRASIWRSSPSPKSCSKISRAAGSRRSSPAVSVGALLSNSRTWADTPRATPLRRASSPMGVRASCLMARGEEPAGKAVARATPGGHSTSLAAQISRESICFESTGVGSRIRSISSRIISSLGGALDGSLSGWMDGSVDGEVADCTGEFSPSPVCSGRPPECLSKDSTTTPVSRRPENGTSTRWPGPRAAVSLSGTR